MNEVRSLVVIGILFLLTGCAGLQQSAPINSSDNHKVSHGMTPSSTGPSPEWYAEYYHPARGVGEALSKSHQAMWDNNARGYTYYISGEIFARYHPWQHGLTIRTDNEDGRNLRCHWSGEGKLKTNGPRPKGLNSKEACTQLLNNLQSHLI
ncbi:hypothetical protein MNBD_GAMMA16-231 [hydrothermal vent metagenome]|uniref:Uncharacterized protein n=1 Tax=hydrothermal vent metagenome TaxID=652676 RepID=A0A3B0ZXN6_9ZZZZ